MQTTNHNWFGKTSIVIVIIFALFSIGFATLVFFVKPIEDAIPVLLTETEVNFVNFNDAQNLITYYDEAEKHFVKFETKTNEKSKITADLDPETVTGYFFSPQLDHLTYTDIQNNLYYYDKENNGSLLLAQNPTGNDWSPDGRYFMYSIYLDEEAFDSKIFLFDTTTKKSEELLTLLGEDGDEVLDATFAHNSKSIVYAFDNQGIGSSYREVNIESKEETDYTEDLIEEFGYSPSRNLLLYRPYRFDGNRNFILYDTNTQEQIELPFLFESHDCAWGTDEKSMFCVDYDIEYINKRPIKKYNFTENTVKIVGFLDVKQFSTNGIMLANNNSQLIFSNLSDLKLYIMDLVQ